MNQKKHEIGIIASIMGLYLFSSFVMALDWPQFQGKDRNGHSKETGLIRLFPETGPKELWKLPVGEGFAGPAVYAGEVYFLDRVNDQQDIVRCLELDTGREKWRHAYDAPGSTSYNGSRTTPTVDEEYIFTVGLLGDFVCTDRKTGKPVWHKHLVKNYGLETPKWGVSQSPSLYNDLVIVAPQAPDAFVAAYQRETGEVLWKSPGLGAVGYSTPVIGAVCGVDQAIMISASGSHAEGRVAGISLENGEILWSYAGWQCKIPIPYAVLLPEDRLFVTGGYKAGSVMLRVTKEEEGFRVQELFKLDMKNCGSHIHQPLFYKDHLYVPSNSNEREDGLICLTLDGKVLWRTKDNKGQPTFERGNLLLADNMIIALDGKRGTLHLIDPLPDGYKERCRAQVMEGTKMWSPMALSNGRLVLRNQEEMKCLDMRPAQ